MDGESYESVLNRCGWLCWRAVGNSMLPMIRPGKDVLVIGKRPEGRCRKHDVILYHRENDGKYILHRILKVNRDGTYFVMGDNCYTGENVPERSVIGVLKSRQRDGKILQADSIRQKAYAAFWCAPYPLRIFITKVWLKIRSTAKKMVPGRACKDKESENDGKNAE